MDRVHGKKLSAADDILHQADAALAQAERLLKIAQVARVWNVSERTVWRDIQSGRLKAVASPSGRIRVPLSALAIRPRLLPPPTEFPRCGVYFVAGPDLVKIGFASNVSRRFTGLSYESAVPLRFLGWIHMPDVRSARRLETEVHRFFSSAKAYSEWFRISVDDAIAFLSQRGGRFDRGPVDECDKPRQM